MSEIERVSQWIMQGVLIIRAKDRLLNRYYYRSLEHYHYSENYFIVNDSCLSANIIHIGMSVLFAYDSVIRTIFLKHRRKIRIGSKRLTFFVLFNVFKVFIIIINIELYASVTIYMPKLSVTFLLLFNIKELFIDSVLLYQYLPTIYIFLAIFYMENLWRIFSNHRMLYLMIARLSRSS